MPKTFYSSPQTTSLSQVIFFLPHTDQKGSYSLNTEALKTPKILENLLKAI